MSYVEALTKNQWAHCQDIQPSSLEARSFSCSTLCPPPPAPTSHSPSHPSPLPTSRSTGPPPPPRRAPQTNIASIQTGSNGSDLCRWCINAFVGLPSLGAALQTRRRLGDRLTLCAVGATALCALAAGLSGSPDFWLTRTNFDVTAFQAEIHLNK